MALRIMVDTNTETEQSTNIDNDKGKQKKLTKDFFRGLGNSIIDALIALALLIIGARIVLFFFSDITEKKIDIIFGEAIGPLTLLVAPFLLSICGALLIFVLQDESSKKQIWCKERLKNVVTGLQGLIVGIVGFIIAKWLWLDGDKPELSVCLIGIFSLLVSSLFIAIDDHFENKAKLPIGFFSLFVVASVLILVKFAV